MWLFLFSCKAVVFLACSLTGFPTPGSEARFASGSQAASWPWMGEVFVDGFLKRESMQLDKYVDQFAQIGCEEITDLLLVNRNDLLEMGMASSEIQRYFRGLEEIRRWSGEQEVYEDLSTNELRRGMLDQTGSSVGNGNDQIDNVMKIMSPARVDPSSELLQSQAAPSPQWKDHVVSACSGEDNGGGLVETGWGSTSAQTFSDQTHWRKKRVGALLGFLDQSHHFISESNSLDLRSLRAIQSMKSLSSTFSQTLDTLQTLGVDFANLEIQELLDMQGNPGKMDAYVKTRAHNAVLADQQQLESSPSAEQLDDLPAASVIRHVRESIRRAHLEISSLSSAALAIDGMSSAKVRHLLNNLCSVHDLPISLSRNETPRPCFRTRFVCILRQQHPANPQMMAISAAKVSGTSKVPAMCESTNICVPRTFGNRQLKEIICRREGNMPLLR